MSLKQQRIAKGLCPQCGEEAAPYYLCGDCRAVGMVGRVLNKAAAAGEVSKEHSPEDARKVRYRATDHLGKTALKFRSDLGSSRPPRIRGIPVDVERELLAMFAGAGMPLRTEEIVEAWGVLRLRKERPSAAADLRQIILAQRKRQRKGAAHSQGAPA